MATTFKFKIYRKLNGKKVWVFRTNEKMKFYEKFDAMYDKMGAPIEQTKTSATW